jgi:hypothetical protein
MLSGIAQLCTDAQRLQPDFSPKVSKLSAAQAIPIIQPSRSQFSAVTPQKLTSFRK